MLMLHVCLPWLVLDDFTLHMTKKFNCSIGSRNSMLSLNLLLLIRENIGYGVIFNAAIAYLVWELPGWMPATEGKKALALSSIACSTSFDRSLDKPENSRLLPSRRDPEALPVAVNVIATSPSAASVC